MATLFYYKYSVSMLRELDLRLFHKFWRKKTGWQFFDKGKQAWLLIISSGKVFDSLVKLATHFLIIITPEVLKSSKT